jgi:hypothetical protein
VEEVTVTEGRGEIEVIVETVIVIEIESEIVTANVIVTVTETEKGGTIERAQVTVAVIALLHNSKINHLSSNQLHLIAIMQLLVCSHPITCNLHQ